MRLMREKERKRQEASAGEGQGANAEETDDGREGRREYGHVEADEGRPIKVPTVPYVPTERERRDHAVTHCPHRTWCEVCMAGRAVAGAHGRSKDEVDPNAGEFHFDYCFLKNVVKEEAAVTLVGVDKASDAILAHVVPEKGTKFEWVASQLDKDMRKLGYHGRIVIQSDGENAVKDLMQELARKWRSTLR